MEANVGEYIKKNYLHLKRFPCIILHSKPATVQYLEYEFGLLFAEVAGNGGGYFTDTEVNKRLSLNHPLKKKKEKETTYFVCDNKLKNDRSLRVAPWSEVNTIG